MGTDEDCMVNEPSTETNVRGIRNVPAKMRLEASQDAKFPARARFRGRGTFNYKIQVLTSITIFGRVPGKKSLKKTLFFYKVACLPTIGSIGEKNNRIFMFCSCLSN